MVRDPALVRGDLETHLDEARRSRLVFVVATVLMTPVLLALAALVALVALGRISHNWWYTYRSYAHLLAAALVAAVLVQLFRPKPEGRSPSQWRSLYVGAGCTVGLVALAFGTHLGDSH